ncbi:MAG: CDP-diacylglycerol--serine O-phosphatidyltransferase [Alphaproteobacteria bacterium]|nr:CDP-diacylglycerol--serine O-phosphatidyltransferase [Alphaproteobacteria bacterium]
MSDSFQKPPRKPLPELPLTRLIPNILTLLSLCAGLSAIRFALNERWQAAIIAVVIAAIFDVLDGRVARMLNTSSKFGAELDSLSDLVSFGIAPALIMYLWALEPSGGLGWIAVLIFVVCAAMRLARFNTMLEDKETEVWKKAYFVGVPTPAGASLALLPLAWSFVLGDEWMHAPIVIAAWTILIGGLMVSRLPTYALKGRRVPRSWIVPIMFAAALVAAALVSNTWVTLGLLGIAYAVSLPVSWWQYRQTEDAQQEKL